MQDAKPVVPLRIFLSYGHDANEDLVRRIYADLKNRGHDVWFDKSEIKVGDDWRRSITDGVLQSNRVLSFLSKHSTRDPGVCLDEIAIAIGAKGGNIQTILVESEQEVQPPPSVSHIQWLDMHDWKERRDAGEAAWEQWYQAKLAEIVAVVESEESRRFAGEIKTLEDLLKPTVSDFAADSRIRQLLEKKLVGRTWLFEAVETWRNSTERESRLFWLMGAPGIGKSAFAAHLAHEYGRGTVIAVQFCDWKKPDHRDPCRIIRTLAFQIAARLPDYRKLLLTLPILTELDRKNSAELFDGLLTNPLKLSITGGRERYLIVIDALDEAGGDGRNELVEVLARYAGQLPDWIGLVVTSRPEFDVTTPFQSLKPFPFETQSAANSDDVRTYLRHELATQLQTRPDAGRLVEQILEKSEGVFLYVEQFCDEAHRGNLSMDHPERFPRGLGGFYYQYFQRQFPDLEKYEKTTEPALGVVLAAREPLQVELLQEILGWRETKLNKCLNTLGSLFPISGTEARYKVIKPYHKSLADWISNREKAGRYFVSHLEGHRRMARYGLSEYAQHSRAFTGYIKHHLPRHLCESADPVGLLSLLVDPSLDYFEQWAERGMAADGIPCLEFLCAYLATAPQYAGFAPIFATQLARLFNRQANPDAAEHWLNITINSSADNPQGELSKAVAWHELGSSALSRGDYRKAHGAYRHALRISRKTSPPAHHEIAANLIGLGLVVYLTDLNVRRTVRFAKLALRQAEKANDWAHIAEACRILADAFKDDMQYAAADEYLNRGLSIAAEHNLVHARLSLLTCRAWLCYLHAALESSIVSEAEAAFGQLLHHAQSAHDWRFEGDAWSGLGQVAVLSGREELLDQSIAQLLALDREPRQSHLVARRRLLEAARLHRSRRFADASIAYAETAEYSARHALWSRQTDALVGQGAAEFHQGATQQAERLWAEAQALLSRCPRDRDALVTQALAACRLSPLACPL